MRLIILLIVLFMSACVSKGKSTSTDVLDSRGNILERRVQISGKDYVDLETNRAIEQSRQAYFSSQKSKYQGVTDPTAQVSIAAINALSSKQVSFGSNSNDVLITRSKESTKKWGIASNLVLPLVGLYSATKGGSGDDRPSINIEANEGSTVDARGVIAGDQNTQNYDEAGGLPFAPVRTNPVEFGSSDECVPSPTCSCDSFEAGECEL